MTERNIKYFDSWLKHKKQKGGLLLILWEGQWIRVPEKILLKKQ